MGHVPERLVLEVPIEGEHFLIDVSDKQVLIAAPEDIGRVDAHPGARLPRLAEAYLGRQRDLFELPLTNFAGAAVHEQEVLHRIVGDKQVQAAIVVDVGPPNTETLAQSATDAGSLPHFREG